jgi:ketosteroid isomerase-like protein
MYHHLVERKLRAVFEAINRGDAAPMVDALAPSFEYRFEGDSPIGGVRNSHASMRQWWARLYRLFPGLQFELRDVTVVGPPWRTRIHTLLEFSVPHDNGRYRNVVMQTMHMRWGRVTWVHTLEDTQRCARFLAWRRSGGVIEAEAAPISDRLWPEDGPFMRAGSGAEATV